MQPFIRSAIAAVVALSLVTAPRAETLSVDAALVRLVTMDAELSQCWRQRAVAAIIVVRHLRKCVAARREAERKLKGELNKRIGTLGSADPLRAEFIDVREALADFTAFMNRLDAVLKAEPEEISPEDAEAVVLNICDDIELGRRATSHDHSRHVGDLPSLCFKPDIGAPGENVRVRPE